MFHRVEKSGLIGKPSSPAPAWPPATGQKSLIDDKQRADPSSLSGRTTRLDLCGPTQSVSGIRNPSPSIRSSRSSP